MCRGGDANKALDVLVAESTSAERMIDGMAPEAIGDGVGCCRFMEGNALSDSELFQQLREQGISQPGETATPVQNPAER